MAGLDHFGLMRRFLPLVVLVIAPIVGAIGIQDGVDVRSDSPGFLQPTEIFIGKQTKMRETDWSRLIADSMELPSDATEYRLPNGTRIDIYDRRAKVAWEVEWSDKWAESISQANFYAAATDATPGVILLLRGNYEEDWLECLTGVIKQRQSGEFRFYFIKTEIND